MLLISHVPPPMGNLVVAAVFSAILGGAAAIAFHFAAPKLRRRFPRALTLVWALVAISTFAIVVQTRATDWAFRGYFSFKTPRERLQDHFADFEKKVSKDPEIRTAYGGLAEDSEVLQSLATRGVPRLDIVTLRQRARLMAAILAPVGDHARVSLLRHAPTTESDRTEIEQAMVKLEAGFVSEWMEVIYKTMLAEVRKSPIPPISSEELTAAYHALEAKIGLDAARRVAAGLREGAPVSECGWAGKTIYEVAPTLEEPHASVLLRYMAQGG